MADVLKTIRMPRHLLETWLTALRSGEYEQGEGALHFNGSYCCLGVLQDVVQGYTERDSYNDEELPTRNWLALHGIEFYNSYGALTNNPFIPSKSTSVAALNDDITLNLDKEAHAFPFSAIADLIELHAEAVD